MNRPNIGDHENSPEDNLSGIPQSKVYTKEFDRECTAQELIREKGIRDYSAFIEKQLRSVQPEKLKKLEFLAETYKTKMLEMYGYIPPITFLLDNSGSMRGAPVSYVVVFFHTVVKLFDDIGIPTEVLGFTTRKWKGGDSRAKWLENRKKTGGEGERNPGRLNDLQHTIFKTFDQEFTEVERAADVMLHEGYMKENIDGEAIAWAYRRISQRPEQKQFIIQISDGAPVDDSTLSVNSSDFFIKHLESVLGYLKQEENLTVMSVFLGREGDEEKRKKIMAGHGYEENFFADTYTDTAVDTFAEKIMPSLLGESYEDVLHRVKQSVGEKLGGSIGNIRDENIFTVSEFFDDELLGIFKELDIDISSIIQNVPFDNLGKIKISPSLLKINLAILKKSGIPFQKDFWRFFRIVARYQNHQHLELILQETSDLSKALDTLENSQRFFQMTEGLDWQLDFFKLYRGLIEEGRCKHEVLQILMDTRSITKDNVEDAHLLIVHANPKMLRAMVQQDVFHIDAISNERDIMEFRDIKKFQTNIALLKMYKVNMSFKNAVSKIAMFSDTASLDFALKSGFINHMDLQKLSGTLSLPLEESKTIILKEKLTGEYESKLKKDAKKQVLSVSFWGVTSYWTLSGITENLSYISLIIGILGVNFIRKGVLDFGGTLKKYKNRNAYLNTKVRDTLRLKELSENFKINYKISLSGKTPLEEGRKRLEKQKEIMEEIKEITNDEVKEELGIDIHSMEVLLSVQVVLLYNEYIVKESDSKFVEGVEKHLKFVLSEGPHFAKENGYHYPYFLRIVDKLKDLGMSDFEEDIQKGNGTKQEKRRGESTGENIGVIQAWDLREAFKILGVDSKSSREEVVSAFRILTKKYHPDTGGDNADTDKFQEVNVAKDFIFEKRGWKK